MTPFPHSVGLDQKLSLARTMMRDHAIRHLPVQHGGKLVGILTERDVQFALAWEGERGSELPIHDVYVPEPYTVSPTTPLKEAATRMATDKLGCALVVEHDRLVGIFTSVDACRVLAGVL